MSTSQVKIESNRRNAQKSTGPRTVAGKNRSRFNAVKHGKYATTWNRLLACYYGVRALEELGIQWRRPSELKEGAQGDRLRVNVGPNAQPNAQTTISSPV
jgi:hypothetical protein